jgi:hypothetical protein
MHTYCGILDDFSLRHHDLSIQTLSELNEHLVAAALFGDRLLINDGYFLFHRNLREAVQNTEESPLRRLVGCGFVKVLTRNKGELGTLADEMAQKGINSAQQLVSDPWYKKTYKPTLQSWSQQLSSGAFDGFISWPNLNRDDIFKSVAETAFNSLHNSREEDRDELEQFHDALTRTAARRTEWEDEAKKLLDAKKISPDVHRKLMEAAGEAYQYSWGCALGASGERVRVLSRLPKHLRAIDSTLGPLPTTPRGPIQLYIPDINFAGRAIKTRWQLLADMVSPGHEVNKLKQAFLESVKKYYSSSDVDGSQTQAAAKLYATALSKHFGKSEPISVGFDCAFLAASTAGGAAVGGPVGIVVGFGIGAIGVAAAHLGGPQLFWRLTAPSPKGWFKKEEQPQKPITSSFELAPEEIKKHTKSAGRYN